jgi:PAS domain-containing protein
MLNEVYSAMRPIPIDVEVKFEGGNMITETDLHGKIVYVNRLFVQMSGYAKEELIGKPHSMMSKEACRGEQTSPFPEIV